MQKIHTGVAPEQESARRLAAKILACTNVTDRENCRQKTLRVHTPCRPSRNLICNNGHIFVLVIADVDGHWGVSKRSAGKSQLLEHDVVGVEVPFPNWTV